MICGYGCQKEAQYPPRKGMTKWCCERHFSKCPNIIKRNSDSNKKLWNDKDSVFNSRQYREKQSKASTGRIPWNKHKTKDDDTRIKMQSESLKNCWLDEKSYFNSTEYRNNLKIAQNRQYTKLKKSINKKYTIKDYKVKHPFFSKIEEMRYNLDKPDEKEIQVHCKNHKCSNSKEKNGWFTPTYIQLYERIRALEKPYGMIENNFYCSQKCKDNCISYRKKNDPYQDNKILPYTAIEYQTCRDVVLERENGLCEYCGEPATDMHHIFPVKKEPFFALDPDYCVACCEKHHYKYGHRDECSTTNLAKMICSVESQKFLNQK